MTYTEKENLTIIQVDADKDSVSMEEVKKILFDSPSNVIYCEVKENFIGLISTGDIYRAYKKDMDRVEIIKKCSIVRPGEYMKAKKIFEEKGSINAIPVVSEDNILLGDYTRWDDYKWLENTVNVCGGGYSIEGWFDKQKIAFVRSNNITKDKLEIDNILKEQLIKQSVEIECVNYREAVQYLEEFDVLLFLDENEIRAFQTLLYITLGRDYDGRCKLTTHGNILSSDSFRYRSYDFYLEMLEHQDVGLIGLVLRENEYYRMITKALCNKFELAGEEVCRGIILKSTYKDFFDDLYNEEYIEQVINIRTIGFENNGGINRLKDWQSEYYNVVNGERCTSNQPKEYLNSIYFVGQCYMLGNLVDDSHTMESLLQEQISQSGYTVRVVNCGCWGMDYYHILARIARLQLKRGDIIVIDRPPEGVNGVQYICLNEVLEKNNVEEKWLNDHILHCNHKVYKLYSDAIYDRVEPVLGKKVQNQGQMVVKDDNYIKFIYLNRYFINYDASKYEKIGAIVMNCNPFTYGHRHLIETALKIVDFLIIFVVEEDLSLFSFTERFTMVRQGVLDLQNVMVVPSGPFILSQYSFPEYFIKETSKDIEEHTEQDIITFAAMIAPQLGIKYRFVGEEPEDEVTNQYNLAMKKIFPRYGIKLIEIPRKTVNGKYISASAVRRYMSENNRNKFVRLIPKTTRKILGLDAGSSYCMD